jgi:hypothetical protein
VLGEIESMHGVESFFVTAAFRTSDGALRNGGTTIDCVDTLQFDGGHCEVDRVDVTKRWRRGIGWLQQSDHFLSYDVLNYSFIL